MSRISMGEKETLRFRGLAPGILLDLSGVRLNDGIRPEVSWPLATLGIVGEAMLTIADLSGSPLTTITVEIAPTKLRQEEFEQLCREINGVWAGLILGDRGKVKIGAPDIVEVWRRVVRSLESLLATPYAPMVRRSRQAPYSMARNIDFRPSRALAFGVATQTKVPVVRSMPEVDNSANRMVALLCERVAHQADRLGVRHIADHARQLRRHPTLSGLSAANFDRPPRVVLTDPRYVRCWSALRSLPDQLNVRIIGPGQMPIALARLMDLYEYWIYLRALLALEELIGPPLEPGYQVLGRQLTGTSVRVELHAGTKIDFPGGVSAAFTPKIPSRRDYADELGFFVPRPGSGRMPVTPDVLVSGPGGLVVLDAKYVAAGYLDHFARDIHSKYGRIVGTQYPDSRVHCVIAVHPNAGNDEIRYAGYAALPMVPNQPVDWLLPSLRPVLAAES